MKKENMFNFSMLLLRAVLGAIFVVHGSQKLFGMFDGIGIEGTAKMMEGFGFPNPEIIAVIWASMEFASGVFLIFGIMSRWAALAVVFLIGVLLWKANISYGILMRSGEIEHYVLIIASSIPIVLLGGGSWAIWDV
ncbi:MAG: DoxX family protein [Candidatus Omnitrophica bacterium]|nr:DoxX family protein [Candidatus Omnitrophota bacterium]